MFSFGRTQPFSPGSREEWTERQGNSYSTFDERMVDLMSAPALALISTGLDLSVAIRNMARERLPGSRIISIVDDSVVATIEREGGHMSEAVKERIVAYVRNAEQSGADAALVTCSSISEAVDAARAAVRIPVFKIDEPMMVKALDCGERIGVVATLATTLAPTVRLLERKAAELGKGATVAARLVDGAFQALSEGRGEEHDALVREAIRRLEAACDAVILAQASMARAVEGFDARVPIFTSLPLGLDEACKALAARG